MLLRTFGRSLRLCAGLAGLAIVVVAGPVSPASAQGQPAIVTAFLATPSQMLQNNPTGGPRMVSMIRDLAVADPATLQVILNLVANANADQRSAIGAGLGQAARIVVRTNPAYANQIQQAIANLKDQDVTVAYAAIAGDQPIGAGAGAGGGGAIGGQTNSLPNTPNSTGAAQNIGSGGVVTGQFGTSSSVAGLSGPVSQ